jgi:beta-phosphoglucomutase-like phosphatase (HAD superfamily)
MPPPGRKLNGMIRNIIFDWSGTLVDDLPAVLAATNAVFEQCGVEKMSLEKFRAEFCLPFKHFYDRFVPNVPLAELERSFHGHFRLCREEVAALPHAREFLLFCRKRGLRTFVLSTVHRIISPCRRRRAVLTSSSTALTREFGTSASRSSNCWPKTNLPPPKQFLLATCSTMSKRPSTAASIPAPC